MQVKIKKLHKDAVIPKYAKLGDAGMDLVCTSKEYVDGRIVYGTGLAVEIPEGHFGLICPRSSICKYDLRLTNAIGIIDQAYRGEIKAIFENDAMIPRGKAKKQHAIWDCEAEIAVDSEVEVRVPNEYNIGDRICQLIILPYPQIEFIETHELSTTERGSGGFGSTGT